MRAHIILILMHTSHRGRFLDAESADLLAGNLSGMLPNHGQHHLSDRSDGMVSASQMFGAGHPYASEAQSGSAGLTYVYSQSPAGQNSSNKRGCVREHRKGLKICSCSCFMLTACKRASHAENIESMQSLPANADISCSAAFFSYYGF